MFKSHPLSMSIMIAMGTAIAAPAVTAAEENTQNLQLAQHPHDEEVVVTGVKTDTPLTLSTDPKAPRQPLPAHDGADYLKAIPGFSVIRKGGSDGDPVFRGMAGSRLNLMLDGEMILGGCSGRMDPPTAYVFPEAYDRITVIKGPQTVVYGPGNSAGTVLFERDHYQLEKSGLDINASVLAGSFGRHDEVADLIGGTRDYYLRGSFTNAEQDDYEDGDGNDVHSAYERWSATLAAGWTPDANTVLELSFGKSDGEAAYADRDLDGAQFERDNLGLKFIRHNLTPLLKKIEAQVFRNDVDHVMDNYSLRDLDGSTNPRAMNVARETQGGRLVFTLTPTQSSQWVTGIDTQGNEHSTRMSMNQNMTRYQDLPRIDDAEFEQRGVFAEMTQEFAQDIRLIAGLRADRWEAEDKRQTVSLGMMMTPVNPTAGETREETLQSSFLRYEQDLQNGHGGDHRSTWYVGVGQTERFPDYWEMIAKETADSISAFDIAEEQTRQLDVGVVYHVERLHGGVSLFYNEINDYLLIEKNYVKGMRTATITRNIDAHSWGGEAEIAYSWADNWRTDATLAYVRGSNETDDSSLAQLPPLEVRLGLNYDDKTWSYGTLVRLVNEQTHVDPNKGNIAGQDIGESSGFGVWSINAGWRPNEQFLLTGGIDNLLDKSYAEHISRSGTMIAGFDQTERVNEPGRTLWVKLQMAF